MIVRSLCRSGLGAGIAGVDALQAGRLAPSTNRRSESTVGRAKPDMTGAPRPCVLLAAPDCAETRALAAQLLLLPAQVLRASDGLRAVETARAEQLAAVIVDLALPLHAAVLSVRSCDARLIRLPLLALADRAPAGMADARALQSVDTVLVKPVEPAELCAAVLRSIEARQTAAVRTLILLVDDDEAIRLGMELRLRSWGYDVACAGDGAAAVTQAIRHKPDLVLLDLGLPCGDGFLVMERLRRVAAGARIVVVSARSAAEVRARALQAGALEFLQKPVDKEVLRTAIAAALER